MTLLKRAALPVILVVAVLAAAYFVFFDKGPQKTLTAYFPRAVSLYQGSDVRVLGVPVGQVESVTPVGTQVKVVMHYSNDVTLPSDVKAVIISPSIVGDRYVQLTPAYSGSGPVLTDNTLQTDRTAVPLELDEIYSSLDRLTVALGPNGANKTGALSDLLTQTARNFGGEGDQFHTTIKNFSLLSKTLDDNKQELFGSAAELQKFITKLADNDSTVRRFNTSLGRVSTTLAAERNNLSRALRNLSTALGQVGTFVRSNRAVLGKNISGLNRVAKVLVRQRSALDETLRTAPLALNNLQLTYNPDAGTLDTSANIGNLANEITNNPKQLLCAIIASSDPTGAGCTAIQNLPLPRTGPFGTSTTHPSYTDKYDQTLGGLVPAPGSAR